MFEIALVNMPFALLDSPSLALTQVQAAIAQSFPGRASATIFYLNHDIAQALSAATYWLLSDPNSPPSGLGDWIFRHIAFPDDEDNVEAYLHQYEGRLRATPGLPPDLDLRSSLQQIRRHLSELLPQLIQRHRLDQFPLVGFSSMFSQNVACLALAQLLKQCRPEVVTVMGGANCTPPMGHVLARCAPQMDFVFAGPALISFPQLTSHLMQGDAPPTDIPGLLSKRRLQLAQAGADELGPPISLDAELPLDFGDYFRSLDQLDLRRKLEPSLPFQTSRGCWWGQHRRCTFCSDNMRALEFEAMSPERALRQFRDLLQTGQRHGVRSFEAAENILPPKYAAQVLPQLSVPRGVNIFYEVRPRLSLAELHVLVKSGVTKVLAGIESLSTPTLRLMNKGVTAFDNITFLKNCLKAGMQVQWNLLVGTPAEEPLLYSRYCKLLSDLVHLPPPSVMDQIRFRRFSEYHDAPSRFGIQLQPAPFYRLTYPFPEHELDDLAFEFQNIAVCETTDALSTWLPRMLQQVRRWQSRWSGARDHVSPELRLTDPNGQPRLLDTRDGTRRFCPLSPLERDMLLLLEAPADLEVLQRKLPHHSPQNVHESLGRLSEHHVLFQEESRYLSLVTG